MEIEHTTHELELGKQIHVFDNVFPLQWRTAAYDFIKNSNFRIGWSDSIIPERKPHDYFLHSIWTERDLTNLGLMNHIREPITSLLRGLMLSKIVINLSTPSDVNHVHTHLEKKVLLYYANHDWHQGFHGETQFWSEDLKRIQLALPYTPGRLVLFDANIPHCIRPQSIIAPQYRFTMAMVFDDANKVMAQRIAGDLPV